MSEAETFMELVKVIHNNLTFNLGREILGVKDADLDWWEDAWGAIRLKGTIGLSKLDSNNLEKLFAWAKTFMKLS